jgi:hypothetical protein
MTQLEMHLLFAEIKLNFVLSQVGAVVVAVCATHLFDDQVKPDLQSQIPFTHVKSVPVAQLLSLMQKAPFDAVPL